jgi:phosphate transport system protein
MTQHLENELSKLKRRLLSLSAAVEDAVNLAVQAVHTRDLALAQQVIAADRVIDLTEVDLEEECLKILALHQPVAIDLRFIIAALKINNDLERIGDMAVNIAQRGLYLAAEKPVPLAAELPEMALKAQTMLHQSLDALVNMDGDLARVVCGADDAVDIETREFADRLKREIRRTPERLEELVQLLFVSRHIERIADLATNIAEDVIYTVDGEIVRHNVGADEDEDS